MYTPHYRQDSFMASVAFALTGYEENRNKVRQRLLRYMEHVVDNPAHHVVQIWIKHHPPSANIETFLQDNAEEGVVTCAYTMASLVAHVYHIKVVCNDTVIKTQQTLFRNERNEVYILYIAQHDGTWCIEQPMQAHSGYTLRVANGEGINVHLKHFKVGMRCHWLTATHLRRDLIYQIYTADPLQYCIDIPKDQFLYVYGKQATGAYILLAAHTGKTALHPYFCLEPNVERIVVIVAENQRDAINAITNED